jgi:O-antigen/teichoic acid export membrane protein
MSFVTEKKEISARAEMLPTSPESERDSLKPLSMRENTLWNTVGTVIYCATNWGMSIALAKLGNPAAVGEYALGVAVAQPVFMFAQLNLRSVLVTDVRREYSYRQYLRVRIIWALLAMLVVTALAITGHNRHETLLVIMLTGIGMAFDSISDIVYGLIQQRERMDRIGISMAIKGIFSLAALTAIYAITHRVAPAVGGSALVSLLVVVFYDLPNSRRFDALQKTSESLVGELSADSEPNGRPAWFIRLSLTSLPLGIVLLLNSLNMNVPRLFVAKFLGEKSLGIFAAMASLLMIGQVLVTATSQAAIPKLAQLYNRGDAKQYLRLLGKIVVLSAAVGVSVMGGCLIFGRRLLTMLFTPEYASQWPAFLWLMIAGVVFYISMSVGIGLTAARVFTIQVWWMLLTVAVVAVSCWFYVPNVGIVGASYALAIGMLVRLVTGAVYIHRLVSRMSARPQQS